jgi:hypothetical protein
MRDRATPRGRLGRAVAVAAASQRARAAGVVLEVGDTPSGAYPDAVTEVRRIDGPEGLASAGPVDAVVSVCELWRPVWTRERLEVLAGLLPDEGRLLFVEPVAVTGLSGRAQRVVAPVLRRVHGIGFDRRLLDDLRVAGLVPTSVDRASIDRVGRVRTIVTGVAHRYLDPPAPNPDGSVPPPSGDD